MIEHGGRLVAAVRRYGGVLDEWLDLSTAINPWPYPIPELPAPLWHRLPEPEQVHELERIAGVAYDAPDDAQVVAAPGTQALIQLLPYLLPPRRVFVLSPTYGEHARCWRRAGHQVQLCTSLDAMSDDTGVMVLTRPNNPDGQVVDGQELRALQERIRAGGGLLVIDEAFVDTCAELSLAAATGSAHLLVLRSFGKFFGLAGMRLGFALTGNGELARQLRERMGPWALCMPAIVMGQQALADNHWMTRSRARLAAMARTTQMALTRAGIHWIGQHPLFTLLHCDAPRVADRLARSRILVRTFEDNNQWLRIGCLPNEALLRRLCALVARV